VDFLRSSEETFSHLSLLTEGIFRFFFWKPENPDKVLDAMDRDRARELLEAVVAGGDSSLTIDGLKAIASGNGLPYPKLLNLIRLSLIDSSKGPPIAELVQFLGVEEIRRRLKAMLNMLKKE
jgi:glutamyl/glutaminyl-tRNA synthetase